MNISSPADPSCYICPPGALVNAGLVDSLNIPSISNGGTCASVASLALGGCFDDVHCYFLQNVFSDLCCIANMDVDLAVGDGDGVPGLFLDTNNKTIIASSSCVEVEGAGATNGNNTDHSSLLLRGNDDGGCYTWANDDGSESTLCLENVFDELCLASLDGVVCDSCDLGVELDGCSDNDNGIGNQKGARLDCSSADLYFNILDVCNNGEVHLSSRYCMEVDSVMKYGNTVRYELCIEELSGNDQPCTTSLDGMPCKSCQFLDETSASDGAANLLCLDKLPGFHIDCSNVDSSFDVDICSDGTVVNVDVRPPTYNPRPGYYSGGRGSSGGSSSDSSGSFIAATLIFVFIFGIRLFIFGFRARRLRRDYQSNQVRHVNETELTIFAPRSDYAPVTATATATVINAPVTATVVANPIV